MQTHYLNAVDHCLKQTKLVFTAPTLTSSHTVSLARGGLTVRWTHREGACLSSVCRLCSAHWNARENSREAWEHAFPTLIIKYIFNHALHGVYPHSLVWCASPLPI